MLLFFISLILVMSGSFLITSVLEQKEFIKIFIYFWVIMFADIVLTFEILSLFSAISELGVLVLNLLFTGIAAIVWAKKGRPVIKFDVQPFCKKLLNTLKADKYLIVLGIAFLFMCAISLFLISFMPVVNPDASAYHVARSAFWLDNGTLNHFMVGDVRNLTMPINSEILYAWVILLTKKQIWFGIFPFIAFTLVLTALYGIMSKIGVLERKKFWVLFLIASFPSVIAQISGTETDIIVAGLVLSSIYLYWCALKDDTNKSLYMSSLCYALAIGTKTPALLLIPAVGLWMLIFSYYYKKKEFYKPFLKFLGFGVVNFFVFASYNYILNLIDFGNISGPKSFLIAHQNIHGIKGLAANFIKHLFLFFDFTGFTWGKLLGGTLVAAKTSLLSLFGLASIPDGVHSRDYNYVNQTLLEPLMGMGILGFLVYLPCWLKSLFLPIVSKDKKDLMISSFAFLLLVAILTMSAEIMFMTFNIRFLTAFCVISAPVLVYSYPRRGGFGKFIIMFFALFSLLFVSTNLWARPVTKIYNYFKQGMTVSQIRQIGKCSLYYRKIPKNPEWKNECKMESKIRSFSNKNKILYFSNESESVFIIKMLQFEGYNIDFGLMERINDIDLSKYNMIITLADTQYTTNVLNNDKEIYYPLSGVGCSYMNLRTKVFNPLLDKAPYIVKCQFGEGFYQLNGYRLYSTLPIIFKENKNSLNLEYKFLENINNPIVK